MVKRRSKLLLALLVAVLVGAAGWALTRGSHTDVEAREARILSANPAARVAHAQGEAAASRGAYGEARLGFETAVRLEPRSALAALNLGLAEAHLQHRAAAVEALRRATTLRPNWGYAWEQLGNALADDRQLPAAAEAAERAVRLSPRTPGGWMVRAHVALLLGNATEAQKWARRALELAPRSATAWLSLGDALMLTQSPAAQQEASRAFQRAAELEPSPYAFRRLGEAQRQSGELVQSVRALRTAVKLAPLDTAAALELGLALQAAGQTEESKKWAAKAQALQEARYRVVRAQREAALQPNDPARQSRLAQEMERQGDAAGAAAIYRRLLRADPLDETSRRALARLEAMP